MYIMHLLAPNSSPVLLTTDADRLSAANCNSAANCPTQRQTVYSAANCPLSGKLRYSAAVGGELISIWGNL